ncbi:IS66 family transposase [Janthinobacterium sp. RT4P48]
MLQTDAYAGFDSLFEDGTICEAACWTHERLKFTICTPRARLH